MKTLDPVDMMNAAALRALVRRVRDAMYLTPDGELDAEQDVSSDHLAEVLAALEDAGLRPDADATTEVSSTKATILHVTDADGRVITSHRRICEALVRTMDGIPGVIDAEVIDERSLRVELGPAFPAVYQLRLELHDPSGRGMFGTYHIVALRRDGTRHVIETVDAARMFRVHWSDDRPSLPIRDGDALRDSVTGYGSNEHAAWMRGVTERMNAALLERMSQLTELLVLTLRSHLLGLRSTDGGQG